MPAKSASRLQQRKHLNPSLNAMSATMRAAALLLLLVASGVTQASGSPATQTVSRLYRDFAWEAVMSDPNEVALEDQPKPILEKYFTPQLAAALVADSDCRARTREICALDFMPLWDSQDASAENLSVTQDGNINRVRVEYNTPSSDGKTGKIILLFSMLRTRAGWRVDDIMYSSGISLTKLLARGAE